jgi:hypothetical protein
MTIAGMTVVGIDTGKHLMLGGGTTQEILLIGSFFVFGLILLSMAVKACTRCRSHAAAAHYTSSRR